MPTLKHNSGFTLIEALVAITVLIIGVLGPLTLAAKGIIDGLYAKNQIAATYLAQEGLEIVTNIRDSNLGTGANWVDGIFPQQGEPSSDTVSYITYYYQNGQFATSRGNCTPSCTLVPEKLQFDMSYSKYINTIPPPTDQLDGPVFNRLIQVDYKVGRPYIIVTSQVFWQDRPVMSMRYVTLTQYLYKQ